MVRKKFTVLGMSCASCSAHVEHDVSKLVGVKKVEVSLMAQTMVVEYDETQVNENDIINAVESGGYTAKIYERNRNINEENDKKAKSELIKLIISWVLMLILMYFSMGHMVGLPLPHIFHMNKYAYLNGLVQLALVIPIICLNFHYYKNGFKRLFKLSPNMDSLIAIGSSASLLYGIFAIVMIFIGINTGNDELITNYKHELYFESAGMILALVSFGKFIENKAKGKTTKAISQLLDLAPKKAHLLKDNEVIDISVDDIKVGDKLIVKPGEQIPIDGVVIEGISEVDEASLTGESNPVLVEKDSNVKGGTTNLNGNFQMMATCESFDSTLQKIIDLVEVASNSKAPMAKLADKISLVFVPIVMSIALLVFIIWILITKNFEFSLARAISVLVISCPCALGLATPVAIMAGTYKAVKCGFLIKSGESLEKMCHVDTIVFDKTGTLTKGKPVVTDVITLNGTTDELLAIANAIESGSEHPLSKSICEYAKKNNVQLVKVTNFENLPGMGVKATYNDKTYYCANHKLLKHSVDQNIVTKLQNEGKTITYIFDDEKVYGIIAIRDEIKGEVKDVIAYLDSKKITPVMLTGDNHNAAIAVAKDCGIKEVIADVMPDQKANKINELQQANRVVAMVGDGINDSVALVSADVGISIGSGTDIAIESSDIVLMKDNLKSLIVAINLSRKVVNNIKMNLFWAFFYNILFIPIAGGILYYPFNIVLNPMLCALSMSLSSICVVLNALRIQRFKVDKE